MSESENYQLPHRFNCDEYFSEDVIEGRYLFVNRVFLNKNTGRMCDFHMQLSDKYTHKLLVSVDCEHQVAHYHDERRGHRNSQRYDFAPASTHDEIEEACGRVIDEILEFCRRKGIIL